MKKWIEGNTPESTDMYYWITTKSETKTSTYPVPCKYDETKKYWVDMEKSTYLDADTVVAYRPIMKPKPYSTIGTGYGYYIRTKYKNHETIYGRGCEYANWGATGYSTIDKAIAALKRMRRTDINQEQYERDSYEVLDGNGEVVWSLKKQNDTSLDSSRRKS